MTTFYGVYISQVVRFAWSFSQVNDFNNQNKILTAKVLKQGYCYHNLRKIFSYLYCRHSELIFKRNEALFLDLNLCISIVTVSTKHYDKRSDFDFDIVNFPFPDGDVPRRTSYRVYIPQLIRFDKASSNLSDFNCSNKALTAKPLWAGLSLF